VYQYCDMLPESRNIGTRIYDCSLDNGLAKHISPTMNQAIVKQLNTLRVNFWSVTQIEAVLDTVGE
jgi:hypothetical protein